MAKRKIPFNLFERFHGYRIMKGFPDTAKHFIREINRQQPDIIVFQKSPQDNGKIYYQIITKKSGELFEFGTSNKQLAFNMVTYLMGNHGYRLEDYMLWNALADEILYGTESEENEDGEDTEDEADES